MTAILGISAFYHDSAAALVIDGEIVSAVQEERFTRRKHDPRYPISSINYVLSNSKLKLEDIDYVAFYDKPFLKFERLLETFVAFAPKGFKQFSVSMPIWLREKLFIKKQLISKLKELDKDFDGSKLLFGEHHFSHAASAFYPSPFEKALVLTIDGVGEWASTSVAIGNGNQLDIVREIHFPHSLGLLYSAFTYYAGFRVNSGEYKLMGLAPYGKPKYKDIIFENLIDLKDDGSFRLNQSYFSFATGLKMVNKKFCSLFGRSVRKPDIDKLEQFHMDIASSIQYVIEKVIIKMTRSLAKEFKIDNLCLAGGVALNCVVNGKILRDKAFDKIWIQPAAGDAGGAVGVALGAFYKELKQVRRVDFNDSMKGSYLGPQFDQLSVEKSLINSGATFTVLSDKEIIDCTVKELTNGATIGWFQGRMEFGPRALGNRSILGDPRSKSMQKNLNLKIKFRESFRPFAPSILFEDVSEWFELNVKSPYMQFVELVDENKRLKLTDKDQQLFEERGIEKLNLARSKIPAVTHVDYSARIQTVHIETNKKFYKLIKKFKEETECPILINTSFNVRGEPIVCSPDDAYKCFMGSEMDYLVIENCFLIKKNQDFLLIENYEKKYEKD